MIQQYLDFTSRNYCQITHYMLDRLSAHKSTIRFYDLMTQVINFISSIVILGLANNIKLSKLQSLVKEGCSIVADYIIISKEEQLSNLAYESKYCDAIQFALQKIIIMFGLEDRQPATYALIINQDIIAGIQMIKSIYLTILFTLLKAPNLQLYIFKHVAELFSVPSTLNSNPHFFSGEASQKGAKIGRGRELSVDANTLNTVDTGVPLNDTKLLTRMKYNLSNIEQYMVYIASKITGTSFLQNALNFNNYMGYLLEVLFISVPLHWSNTQLPDQKNNAYFHNTDIGILITINMIVYGFNSGGILAPTAWDNTSLPLPMVYFVDKIVNYINTTGPDRLIDMYSGTGFLSEGPGQDPVKLSVNGTVKTKTKTKRPMHSIKILLNDIINKKLYNELIL